MENRVRNVFFFLLALAALARTETSNQQDNHAGKPLSSPESAVPAAPVAATATDSVVSTHEGESAKATDNVTAQSVVQIDVYYEALCSDSVHFITDKLVPVYEKLNKYINVTFNPFAQGEINKINNETVLKCRRLEVECNADKAHACALHKITDKDQKVNFVKCLFVKIFENNTTIPFELCGNQSKIDNNIIKSIKTCYDNEAEYLPLLEQYKNLSKANNVVKVPRVYINKTFKDEENKLSASDFKKLVCDIVLKSNADEPECKGKSSGSDTVIVGMLPILISAYYFMRLI